MTAGRKRIVIFGAGAVGGYVGGHLARVGEDVCLIDPWPEHVDTINATGLHLEGTQGEHLVRVPALHLEAMQTLSRTPVNIAILCTKSFDTEWATYAMTQYLAPDGFVVSMQNGMNEEQVAAVAGAARTVGCIVSTISVNCYAPGRIKRFQQPGGSKHTVFRVGELHGRVTERASGLAAILGQIDSAAVTRNLWGERWTKLTTNSITHGILGATGLDNRSVYLERGTAHRLGILLAGEAVAVGRALGYQIGTILGLQPDDWYAAATGDDAALETVRAGLAKWMTTLTEPSQSSVGRDVTRGRRSEIEYTNGLIAAKGAEMGVPAPTHAALTDIVRRIDCGLLKPDPANIEGVLANDA
jgi:2-dehydropantoate 2-reductase